MMNLLEDFLWRIKRIKNEPDLPIFAAIYKDNKLLSLASNFKERGQVSFYHAEILAIKEASLKLQNWRLSKCTLITNLCPCDLCLEAIEESRIEKVYFLAYRKKKITKKYSFSLMGGFFHLEQEERLKKFFKDLRESCPSGLRSTLGKRV